MARWRPGRHAQSVDREGKADGRARERQDRHDGGEDRDCASEITVSHSVANTPQVYATPTMILHMEMASGAWM
jgi:hypothetical protein